MTSRPSSETAFLAYTFGLRHAVDADHIAAIDNVTRKLMQEGKRPVSVGFFFSLGHSAVVIVLSLIVYMTASAFENQLDSLKDIGGVIGTSISAYYNLTITFVSVIVALVVAGMEVLGLLKDQLHLSSRAWDLIDSLNDNFGTLGFAIIARTLASAPGNECSDSTIYTGTLVDRI